MAILLRTLAPSLYEFELGTATCGTPRGSRACMTSTPRKISLSYSRTSRPSRRPAVSVFGYVRSIPRHCPPLSLSPHDKSAQHSRPTTSSVAGRLCSVPFRFIPFCSAVRLHRPVLCDLFRASASFRPPCRTYWHTPADKLETFVPTRLDAQRARQRLQCTIISVVLVQLKAVISPSP